VQDPSRQAMALLVLKLVLVPVLHVGLYGTRVRRGLRRVPRAQIVEVARFLQVMLILGQLVSRAEQDYSKEMKAPLLLLVAALHVGLYDKGPGVCKGMCRVQQTQQLAAVRFHQAMSTLDQLMLGAMQDPREKTNGLLPELDDLLHRLILWSLARYHGMAELLHGR
jgi:hypothetical protein